MPGDEGFEPKRATSRFIDRALDRARARVLDGWRVVGVRPDGVILETRCFGRAYQVYCCADALGAP